jgi:hypothetical protein
MDDRNETRAQEKGKREEFSWSELPYSIMDCKDTSNSSGLEASDDVRSIVFGPTALGRVLNLES